MFIEGQKAARKDIGNTYLVSWEEIEKLDDKIKELYNEFVISTNAGVKVSDDTMVHELENIAWMQMRFEDAGIAYDGLIKYGLWMQDCFADPSLTLWPYATANNRR